MITLAFKYVAIAAMMAEINYYADKLQLKQPLPIQKKDIILQRASEIGKTGFTGRIDTAEYAFSFAHGGKFRVITKLEDKRFGSFGWYRGNLPMNEFMDRLSQIPSTVNTNDVYQITTNWLMAINLDVQKLNASEPLIVKQEHLQSNKGVIFPVPLFHVIWGDRGQDDLGHHIGPIIHVIISGIDGKLLSFTESDNSYSKRPMILIKDMEKLLAITDEEFLKYSDLERSNLVVRFSAVTYPAVTNVMPQTVTKTKSIIATNAPSSR